MTVEDGTNGGGGATPTPDEGGGGGGGGGGTGTASQHIPQPQQQDPNVNKLRAEAQPEGDESAVTSFAQFAERNPTKARGFLNQVAEVTGHSEQAFIAQAFDRSRRGPGGEFSVANAIEWILELPANQPGDLQLTPAAAAASQSSKVILNQPQKQVAPNKRPLPTSISTNPAQVRCVNTYLVFAHS
jgi:hypothetical protein